jgi:amidase
LLLRAVDDLEALGAEVRWTSLPLRDAYEAAPRDLKTFADEGLIPRDWMEHEWLQLNAAALQEFITSFDMSGLDSLLDVNPDDIFPNPFNSVAHRTHWQYGFYQQAAEYIRSGRLLPLDSTPKLAEGLRGLESIRQRHLEEWMRSQRLDVLIFPTNSNIGRADADVDTVHNTEAWQDGTFFSNGNRMIRHLGIPTVSVNMGLMDDTGVPAGLTFMAPSGSDRLLLACAYAYEQSGHRRTAPARTPPIQKLARIDMDYGAAGAGASGPAMQAALEVEVGNGAVAYSVHAAQPEHRCACRIFINGMLVDEWSRDEPWTGEISLASIFDARRIAVVALYSGSGGSIGADVKVRDMPRLGATTSSLI